MARRVIVLHGAARHAFAWEHDAASRLCLEVNARTEMCGPAERIARDEKNVQAETNALAEEVLVLRSPG